MQFRKSLACLVATLASVFVVQAPLAAQDLEGTELAGFQCDILEDAVTKLCDTIDAAPAGMQGELEQAKENFKQMMEADPKRIRCVPGTSVDEDGLVEAKTSFERVDVEKDASGSPTLRLRYVSTEEVGEGDEAIVFPSSLFGTSAIECADIQRLIVHEGARCDDVNDFPSQPLATSANDVSAVCQSWRNSRDTFCAQIAAIDGMLATAGGDLALTKHLKDKRKVAEERKRKFQKRLDDKDC